MSNEKLMNTRVRQKIDTAENWAKATGFSPLEGELIVYSDLHKIKVGDGTTNVNDLPFSTGGVTYVTAIWDPDQSTLVCSHNPREIKKMVNEGQLVSLSYEGSFYALADVWCDDDPDYLDDDCATFYYTHEDPHTSIWWVRGDKTIDQQDNYYATQSNVERAIEEAIAGIDSGTKNLVVTWDRHNMSLDGTDIAPSHTYQEISEFYQNNPDAIIILKICTGLNITNIFYLAYINQRICKFVRSDDDYIYVCTFSNSSNLPTQTAYRLPKSTLHGGSIFGDTDTNEATGSNAVVMGESSEALGDNSLAIGKEVQTGCKGYYIKAIDPANRYIYLATSGVECIPTWDNPDTYYNPNFNTGYQVFDLKANPDLPSYQNEFSISSEDYYHWVFAGNIRTISGNCIIYDTPNILSDNPDKEHVAYKKWMENFEGKAKPMKFYVPTQSEAGNIVTGHYTLAVGKGSVAADDYAIAEGRYNLAVGYAAHVEGDSNRAGYTSHAEGVRTQALGLGAHTEGQETIATGRFAHAQGSGSEATGDFAHAGGFYSKATGISSCAQGSGTKASGMYANAQGVNTIASGRFSHAGGRTSIAAGEGTIAQGENPAAFAPYSVALGYKTQTGYADAENQKEFQHLLGGLVTGESMTFEGEEQSQIITIPLQATQVDFSYTTEEEVYLPGNDFDISLELTLQYLNEKRESIGEFKFGTNNIPTGARYMQINGQPSTTGSAGFAAIHMRNISFQFTISQSVGTSSLAFGSYTAALGNHSLAGGLYTTASGSRSLAFGEGSSDDRTEASGDVSVAIGKHVKATNTGSIALGADTTASGEYSIALGKNTEATMPHAFANGINTKATQSHAIALGSNSNAKGIASLAFGDTNNAEKAYTWALGQRNTVNAIHSLAVGRDNTTNGQFNLAIGENNTTSGKYAMALGYGAQANGENAIAIGNNSNANKSYAVAIGCDNTASAAGAFALGYGTTAGGKYSTTLGQYTSTAAEGALAFGNHTKANATSNSGAYNSLVGGYYSESSHNATIVVGNQLRSANINGAVFGQYNSIEGLGATANDRALLILGNGSSDSARSNAFVVLRDGRMILGSGSHGTALPASGYEGQIFFLES